MTGFCYRNICLQELISMAVILGMFEMCPVSPISVLPL